MEAPVRHTVEFRLEEAKIGGIVKGRATSSSGADGSELAVGLCLCSPDESNFECWMNLSSTS
jgi:hypothetical protein